MSKGILLEFVVIVQHHYQAFTKDTLLEIELELKVGAMRCHHHGCDVIVCGCTTVCGGEYASVRAVWVPAKENDEDMLCKRCHRRPTQLFTKDTVVRP